MEPQKCLSLAIQALHERFDNIQRRTPDNANALQECREAVAYLEGMKVTNQWLAGFTNCKFSLYTATPCLNEDGSEKE